mgnify:CR=1 FL=1
MKRFVIRHISMQERMKSLVTASTTRCLHLHPRVRTGQQQLRGIARHLLNHPSWKIILHAVLYFEAHSLVIFLQAKRGRYGGLTEWWRQV